MRQEINHLRSENRTLRSYLGQTSSPLDVSVHPPVVMSTSSSPFPTAQANAFHPLALYDSAHESATDETAQSSSQDEEHERRHRYGTDSEPFCAIFPQEIAAVRRDLYMRLGPVLDLNILRNPRLHLSTLAALGPSLPPSLQPTLLQLQTPHHAYIDLIPSPKLRDSLIQAGVAIANTFLTEVCTFVYEAEDTGQLIIWGRDYLNVMAWEFSEEALKAWPSLLTAEWRERANFWRAQRNEPLIEF